MKKILMATALLATSGLANAAIIDFNTAAGNANGYTEQGVTFTEFGANLDFATSSANSRALLTRGDGDFIIASLTGTASSISVDLGDTNADADRLFLSVFDSADNLLGTVTEDIATSFIGMRTLSLSFANIAYAHFGSTGELGLGGIYADNFTFESSVSEVPVPAAAFLFAPALLGFMGLRRKANKQA